MGSQRVLLVERTAVNPPCDPGRLLEVTNLTVDFTTRNGDVRAVDRASFTTRAGECLAIVGESGSGKTVLSRAIMGLLPPRATIADESSITFAGSRIDSDFIAASPHFLGGEVALIPQEPMRSLNPVRSVGAQLCDGLRVHLALSRRAAKARGLELLADVGIDDPRRRFGQYPHELSGGLRQRVLIAIAIACNPRMVIADEPTTALDVTIQRQILDLLTELRDVRGLTMLLITHDLAVVQEYCDRVLVMYGGQVMEHAPVAGLFCRARNRYSEALLDSIPNAGPAARSRLRAIDGAPPDLLLATEACRFSPRCAHASEACSVRPTETIGSSVHSFFCHHPADPESAPTSGEVR